jgi:hypothetical protein
MTAIARQPIISPNVAAFSPAVSDGRANAGAGMRANQTATVQLANNALANIGEILKPDAIVYGETHGATPLGIIGRGGNFGLISTKDGSQTYFGTQLLRPLPPIPTPLGPARGGISLVGTNGGRGDESGLGVAYKFPTPAGELLFFINGRQDAATGGNLIDALQGNAQGTVTASVNLGVAYSLSDGAATGIGAIFGGPIGANIGRLVADGTGADAWVGAAWRGSATFENGQLKSINISGVEIPAADIGNALGDQVQRQRQSPTLIPNRGSNEIASLNDNIQLLFGQSPWDVGHSAIKRDARGAVEVRGGTVDVRNHGNSITALTEPFYELGVKYGALRPGEKITSNAQAGQIADRVLDSALQLDQLNKVKGISSQNYVTALNRLTNPYQLNFGSQQLTNFYNSFNSSGANQTLTNTSRALQGLPQLPTATNGISPPADRSSVRSIFQGALRWPDDLSSQVPATPAPPNRFRF